MLNKENAVAKANQALVDAKFAVSQKVEPAHVEQQVASGESIGAGAAERAKTKCRHDRALIQTRLLIPYRRKKQLRVSTG